MGLILLVPCDCSIYIHFNSRYLAELSCQTIKLRRLVNIGNTKVMGTFS